MAMTKKNDSRGGLDEKATAAETENKTDENKPGDAAEITVDDLIGKLAELQKKAEAEAAKAKEMTDMAQRLQAEFDNYRRRSRESAAKAREDAIAEVVTKLIPTLDVIGEAQKMISDENVRKGVAMISGEIERLIKSYGAAEIEAAGKPFDPRLHEAIMQAPAEKDEDRDTVKEVFQKGYTMGERILRPARVIVNK